MSRLWFAECRARVVRSRGSRVLVAVRRLRHGIPRLVSPDPFASVRVRDSRMGHLCFSALYRDRDYRDALSRTTPRALSPVGSECVGPCATKCSSAHTVTRSTLVFFSVDTKDRTRAGRDTTVNVLPFGTRAPSLVTRAPTRARHAALNIQSDRTPQTTKLGNSC